MDAEEPQCVLQGHRTAHNLVRNAKGSRALERGLRATLVVEQREKITRGTEVSCVRGGNISRREDTVDEKHVAGVLPEAWKEADEFLEECRKVDTLSQKGYARFVELVRLRHREIFGEDPPDVSPHLIQAKVGYELQRRGFEANGCGHLLTERFWRNYNAAQSLCIDDFVERTRMFLEMLMRDGTSRKRKGGEERMAKKARGGEKAPSKAKLLGTKSGLNIKQTLYAMLTRNEELAAAGKKPLTDEQLAAQVKVEFPGRKTAYFDNWPMLRSRFNSGGVLGFEPLDPPARQYDAEGNVVTRTRRTAIGGDAKKRAMVKPPPKKTVKVKVKRAK